MVDEGFDLGLSPRPGPGLDDGAGALAGGPGGRPAPGGDGAGGRTPGARPPGGGGGGGEGEGAGGPGGVLVRRGARGVGGGHLPVPVRGDGEYARSAHRGDADPCGRLTGLGLTGWLPCLLLQWAYLVRVERNFGWRFMGMITSSHFFIKG